MITDRDLFIALGTRNRLPADMLVGEVAACGIGTCNPDDDIRDALKTMKRRQVRRLPVVNADGVPVGVLSMDDVILHAEHCIGTKRTGISYEDAVSTLRSIYAFRRKYPVAA
jgi:predicted transcriptional regulator